VMRKAGTVVLMPPFQFEKTGESGGGKTKCEDH
jgi:hypothetical protein